MVIPPLGTVLMYPYLILALTLAACDMSSTATKFAGEPVIPTALDDTIRVPPEDSIPLPPEDSIPAAPTDTAGAVRGDGAQPQMPRVYVDTRMPSQTGKVIRVPADGDFDAALTQARRGDVIELEAGATYEGTFQLPPKDGDGWIVIRSSMHAQLPSEGSRVRPEHGALMPKLLGGKANKPVLEAEEGASYYRLVGIEIGLKTTGLPRLINSIIVLHRGSHHIVLDRGYIHGTPTQSLQRCITMNSAWTAVIDSWVDDCHAKGFDSQAIEGWSGPGPYKIVNNYLAGAGENIMFGGAAIGRKGDVPADIEIRRNHIHKPLEWKKRWTVKNLFELKIAERVLVEENVFENNWSDAQVGHAVVIKSENRDKELDRPDIATTDVTFRNNKILNSRFGASLHGGASTKLRTGEGRTARILIENNVWELTEGQAFDIKGVEDLTLRRNTASGRMGLEGEIRGTFTFEDNVLRGPIIGSGMPEGNVTLDKHAPRRVFRNNAIFGVFREGWYPAGEGNVYSTKRNLPYTGAAGANEAVLEQATGDVVRR